LGRVVSAGSLIYIDDGLISVRVDGIIESGTAVAGEVLNNGVAHHECFSSQFSSRYRQGQ